jgi:hypothetical protein
LAVIEPHWRCPGREKEEDDMARIVPVVPSPTDVCFGLDDITDTQHGPPGSAPLLVIEAKLPKKSPPCAPWMITPPDDRHHGFEMRLWVPWDVRGEVITIGALLNTFNEQNTKSGHVKARADWRLPLVARRLGQWGDAERRFGGRHVMGNLHGTINDHGGAIKRFHVAFVSIDMKTLEYGPYLGP